MPLETLPNPKNIHGTDPDTCCNASRFRLYP